VCAEQDAHQLAADCGHEVMLEQSDELWDALQRT